jgi:hypothetical protein
MLSCRIKALCRSSGCTTFVITGELFPDENEAQLVYSLYEGYNEYYKTKNLDLPYEELCLGSRIIISVIEPMTRPNKTLRDFGFYLSAPFLHNAKYNHKCGLYEMPIVDFLETLKKKLRKYFPDKDWWSNINTEIDECVG